MTTPDHSNSNTQVGEAQEKANNNVFSAETKCICSKPDAETSVYRQIFLGVIYVIILSVSLIASFLYYSKTPRLAFAWLAIGVVASQIAIDLAVFSSARSKAYFSATSRLIAGLLLLAIAYSMN